MHWDVLSCIKVDTEGEYIVTSSVDGHIKFWQKTFKLIDFVKHFKAHRGCISDIAINSDLSIAISVG